MPTARRAPYSRFARAAPAPRVARLPTIRMADEVNLALARIYERNCPGRIIGKSKGVLASPRSVAPTTVVLRRQQLIVVAERFR